MFGKSIKISQYFEAEIAPAKSNVIVVIDAGSKVGQFVKNAKKYVPRNVCIIVIDMSKPRFLRLKRVGYRDRTNIVLNLQKKTRLSSVFFGAGNFDYIELREPEPVKGISKEDLMSMSINIELLRTDDFVIFPQGDCCGSYE